MFQHNTIKIMNGRKGDKPISKESDRILISFYLSADTLERLDDVLFYARKRLPIGKRRKLTKSVLYEIGIKMVIEDYHQKGDESFLWETVNKIIQNNSKLISTD